MDNNSTPFELESHASSLLSNELYKQAVEVWRAKSVDNSPQLDALLFRDLLELTSGLNLGNLAHECTASCNELPLLNEALSQEPASMSREGYLMAAAFETGRRYSLMMMIGLLSGEVEVLPDERCETSESVVTEG